jgi:hypothetical protein
MIRRNDMKIDECFPGMAIKAYKKGEFTVGQVVQVNKDSVNVKFLDNPFEIKEVNETQLEKMWLA